MYDNFSFVEVPQEYAAAVLEAMNHSKIKRKFSVAYQKGHP